MKLRSCLLGVLRLHNPNWEDIWQGLVRNVNPICPLWGHLRIFHMRQRIVIEDTSVQITYAISHGYCMSLHLFS